MKYWLCVTNEENWPIIKEKLVWGVPEKRRNLIARVKPGDILVIYVKPKKIGGVFKVTSEPYEDRKKVFKWRKYGKEDVFPHRVNLEPVIVSKEPVDLGEVIPSLDFIQGKKQWSAPLRKGMIEISKEDYEKLRKTLEKA